MSIVVVKDDMKREGKERKASTKKKEKKIRGGS
jgi:hypothetical protein